MYPLKFLWGRRTGSEQESPSRRRAGGRRGVFGGPRSSAALSRASGGRLPQPGARPTEAILRPPELQPRHPRYGAATGVRGKASVPPGGQHVKRSRAGCGGLLRAPERRCWNPERWPNRWLEYADPRSVHPAASPRETGERSCRPGS